ncbi:lipopolysaccharide biosynthesis protein [Primorskyibacter aestuariivivens]|uniref:lipopolysaccharide biosynthesis protein n=1 Tax=Primorskyibacter aestuariivivens TaxID=1888912 RepID=UPI0023008310|nr:lipopolysaccharide biosynthesis protein [Primorskyibacter aestuariivivens]MDA7429629.1 lipopolysaccharide biosynthesis protein [Primorskyibacter aestuariivivens]
MTGAGDARTRAWRAIARTTVGNSAWSYLASVLGKSATFIATIVLARLLIPEQFGLAGYCIFAMQFLDIISRFGLDAALISQGDKAERDGSSVLALGIAAALLSYAVAYAIAPALADFFRAPEVTELFRVLALVLVIESFGLVHNAILSVRLRFRAKLVPVVGRNIVKGCVAVALALNGFGVWSLVWGQLAGSLFATLAFWMVCDWRPSRQFDRDAVARVMRYGGSMIGVELIGALRGNIDYGFVGRALGAGALGLYTMAYRLPELVIRTLNGAVGNVVHPVLVGLRDNPDQTREYYLTYLRFIALLTLPMGIGMAVISEAFVLSFYGARWSGAVFPMQAVSVALAVSSVGYAPGVLYKALNRPDILRNLSFAKLPVLVVVLWSAVGWGINGVAVAQVGLALFYVTLDSVVAGRFAGISLAAMMRALWPALFSSAVMGLCGAALSAMIGSNDLLELGVLILVCLPLYVALVRVISPRSYTQMIGLLRRDGATTGAKSGAESGP